MNDLELVFRVRPAEEGGFTANCRLADGLIATQGDSWEELESMVKDAVSCHFADAALKPGVLAEMPRMVFHGCPPVTRMRDPVPQEALVVRQNPATVAPP